MSTGAVGSERTPLQSQAEGGIVAEVRLDHPDLVLRPTLRRAPDVTVDPEYRTIVGTNRTVLYVTARGSTYATFESALREDPTVDEPTLVERYADRRVYRVELTDRAITYVPKTAELGGRVLGSTSSRDGWIVELRLPDRDSLVEFNEYCRERDVTFQVTHLRSAEGEEDAVVGLTEKQQELLTVAYEQGYFEVPRGISQSELADRLNVSKSAISQQLRRAIAALCEGTLD